MTLHKNRIMLFLIPWTFAMVILSGTLSLATDIAGNWQSTDQTDTGVVLFFFGSEDDFFIEDDTSWIQGSYIIQPDSVPGQVDLYIQDGSNDADIGKTIRYRYHVHDDLLTLFETDQGDIDRPTTLEAMNPAGSSAFIGINTDPPDEDDEKDKDDTNWNFYATCFVMSSMTE